VFNFVQTRFGNQGMLDKLRSDVRPDVKSGICFDPRELA
jgi:hypothetical protein